MTEDLTQGLPNFGTLILKDANSTDDERDQIRPVAGEIWIGDRTKADNFEFSGPTTQVYYQGKFWSLPGAGVGLDGNDSYSIDPGRFAIIADGADSTSDEIIINESILNVENFYSIDNQHLLLTTTAGTIIIIIDGLSTKGHIEQVHFNDLTIESTGINDYQSLISDLATSQDRQMQELIDEQLLSLASIGIDSPSSLRIYIDQIYHFYTNLSPTDLFLSSSSFDENIAIGTSIAIFSSSDPNSTDTHTYSLVPGNGDTDNNAFTIEGNKLINNELPNYEIKNSYSIRVQTTDSGGLTLENTFHLDVNDIAETQITTSLIDNDPIGAYPSDQFSSSNSYVNTWVDRDSLVGFISLIKIDSNHFVAAYILEDSEGINVDIGVTDKSEGEGSQKGRLIKNYLIPFNNNYADKNKILERQTKINILESCTDEYGNLYHVMESFDTDTWDKGILELIKLDKDGRLVFRSEISEKALASITGLGVDQDANILVTGNTEYPETNVFAQKYNGENGELLWEIFPFEDAYEGFSIRNSESSLTMIEDGTALIAGAGYFYPSQQGSQIVSNYIAEINTNLGTVIGLHKVDDGHYSENDYWSHEFNTDSEGLYFRTFKGNYLVNGTNSPINTAYKTDNIAPSNINISSLLFDENIAPESIVAFLTATDENQSDNFTYSLISGIGDADNNLFTINGDQLIINTSPNYEIQNSYSVRIQTTDSGGLNFSKSFVLTVNDLLEMPPTPIPVPEPAPELEAENQINRLYDPSQGKHLFSSNQYEIDLLTSGGWVNEGVIYNAPTEATTDVFRFYIPAEGRHFYTALEGERDFIIGNQEAFSGWQYEGAAFSAYSIIDYPDNAVAVVRYLNQETGSHVYSTSTFEQSVLDQDILWLNEGVAWYGDPMFSTNTLI